MLLDDHTGLEMYRSRLADCERRARYSLHRREFRLPAIQRLANRTGRLLMHLGRKLASYGYEANATLVQN